MHSRQHAAAPTREVEGAALAEETDAGSHVAGLGQLLPAGLGVVAVLPIGEDEGPELAVAAL